MTSPATQPIVYDAADDNCAGGCSRADTRRAAFMWFGQLSFACPGCYEAIFGGKPTDDQIISTEGAST